MRKIVIYDFDGTLTPYPITNFKVLEKCGYIGGGNNKDFQKIVQQNCIDKNINVYESFYELLLETLKHNNLSLKNDILAMGADEIELNNGVYEFLETLHKNDIENYIISSSIKPFLEKIKINKFFKNIYATSFKYDESGNIIEIDNLLTDDKKVDVIKSIVKNNNFSNIIYIGDGLTDLKAMKYVKDNGGISIYVTDEEVNVDKNIVSYFFKRDYGKNSEISNFILNFFKIK